MLIILLLLLLLLLWMVELASHVAMDKIGWYGLTLKMMWWRLNCPSNSSTVIFTPFWFLW
jgi:hypothetical protein